MLKIITHILLGIKTANLALISEAGNNPDKWFELMVIHENGGTESVFSADTFDEITPQEIMKYFEEYRFDNINIDIWENRESPNPLDGLMSDSLIYSLLVQYYKKTGDYCGLAMVGELSFSAESTAVYNSDYSGEGYYFKDELAFKFFKNLSCYVSESEFEDMDAAEDNVPAGSSFADFIKLTDGNIKLAEHLFFSLDWQHPGTLIDEMKRGQADNDIKEDRIVAVTVKLKFPGQYTDEQISNILTDCDYSFNYPVEDGETEVQAIDSEIVDYTIK